MIEKSTELRVVLYTCKIYTNEIDLNLVQLYLYQNNYIFLKSEDL